MFVHREGQERRGERKRRRKGGVCSVFCGVVDDNHLHPAGEEMAAFSN